MTLPFLLGNQFFSGGLVLMLTGGLMALLRQTPVILWRWLARRFTVSVLITDRDPLFEWTKLWLDSLPYSRRARNLSCSLWREADEEFSSESRMLFSPAIGRHFFRHGGRLVWLEYRKPDQPATGQPSESNRPPEKVTLTVLGTDQNAVRELVGEIAKYASAEEQRRSRAYLSSCGWWRRMPNFRPREIETVYLPVEDEQRILGAIENFLESRQLYAKRGIPYHLNFLFAGMPGTGKTSIASALCGHFGLNLHLLNIAGPGMNDDSLVSLMLSLPRRSMILMEDVDALMPDRRARPKQPQPKPEIAGGSDATGEKAPEGVTLSGLLNCMDGLTAPDGAVIVMTTNHPELIDAALLRPGRVDVRVDFGSATREQIEKMCNRLAPARHLNGQVESMMAQKFTTAQVQAELLRDFEGRNAN